MLTEIAANVDANNPLVIVVLVLAAIALLIWIVRR